MQENIKTEIGYGSDRNCDRTVYDTDCEACGDGTRYIYVLLTCSSTMVSRIIRRVTKELYTHASIAYDDELRTLTSFGRKFWRIPLPAGLVKENLSSAYFKKQRNMPSALMKIEVSEKTFDYIRCRIDTMWESKEEYGYDLRGLFTCMQGTAPIKDKHYFCSFFVAELLKNSGAVRTDKAPHVTRPQDIFEFEELECIFKGPIWQLSEMFESWQLGETSNLSALELCDI